MTTSTLSKTRQVAQACQWIGLPAAGLASTPGGCTREATLTGVNNGGNSTEQHLCTQHMRARGRAGHGYTFVWPCTANGWSRYGDRPLSALAARLTL